ncbi:MAG: inorganic phosphate transporter, partial [Flavobacteriaceae bacterium]|nr:inorganic phosphate transporter [Flavobacteriaceae bacterium]
GIACGALFSSGMMEVARKGIFVPGNFMFDEIMIIFMAVMITDILLLDIFNTLGMPTSTTVSIVFNLLGAAVCIALIKISGDDTQSYSDLFNYINTEKAKQIIGGILLSVFVAFSIGALVQYISRILLSFHFEKKATWVGALFGGIALTALVYFILMKGIKGADIAKQSFDFTNGLTIRKFLESYVLELVTAFFVFWTGFSYVFMKYFNQNIYKLIIIIGTFSLALAFAGNDLVNFIGVPIAGWQSFEAWNASIGVDGLRIPATEFAMDALGKKVETPTLWLFLASAVMVATLWLSSKSKEVLKTSLNLSSQGETKERFQPNFVSRGVVRGAIFLSKTFSAITPDALSKRIDTQFEKPVIALSKDKTYELPAFDMVRASVNLMVAGILISIATSYKLPLSTTYVTFMVAMGTSLADRAWGAESAVYRVAGVLNVIGGWFLTAFSAFFAAAVVAFLISWNVKVMVPLLLLVTAILLTRNMLIHRKKARSEKEEDSIVQAESSSVQGVVEESADNIRAVVSRTSKIYTNTIDSLAKQDLEGLKKSKKGVKKLNDEVEALKDNIFYFIKNLDESSIGASDFYINVIGNLQDMSQSLEYISKASHKHVNNNHLKLRFNQIKDLKETEQQLKTLFGKIKSTFSERDFENINTILDEKQQLLDKVNERIKKQVARTRTEESSPKNTTLYFSLLLETKDLIKATMNLLEAYKEQ